MIIKNNEEKLKVEKLYIKYNRLMYKVAYNILNDKYTSEDAVQLSFIKVIKNLNKIDEIESKKTLKFLITICKNTAIDIYNKKKNFNKYLVKESLSNDIVSEKIIGNENLNELLEIIYKLKSIDKEVIILKFIFNYSVIEISKMLNINIKTVQKRIERAKLRLLKELKKEKNDN